MKLSALPVLPAVRYRSLAFLALAGALFAVLAIGCSPATTQDPSGASPSRSATTPRPTAPAMAHPTYTSEPTPAPSPTVTAAFVGAAAPDFPLKLFQGQEALGDGELNLSDITGQPMVLNFWARFCGPCWSEMPELQEFYEEQGDRLRLLGIDVGQFTGLGSPKDAGRLLDALGITYPAGYTDDATITSKYRIRAMPTTVFIDANGRIFRAWTGSIDRQQLELIVAEMLSAD